MGFLRVIRERALLVYSSRISCTHSRACTATDGDGGADAWREDQFYARQRRISAAALRPLLLFQLVCI